MDWDAAIGKNRDALKRILAMLVAMAEVGLGEPLAFFGRKCGGGPDRGPAGRSKPSPALTCPRQLHRFVLALLRPAEAAARRLIIVAARGLVLPPARRRKPGPRLAIARKTGSNGAPPQNPAFRSLPLLDRLSPWRVRAARRMSGMGVPRISVPGYSEPFPIRLPSPDDPIDATRLALRLQALAAALDDLPGQAKRFARWRARAMPPQNPSPPGWDGLAMPRRLRRVSPAMVPARSRRIWPLRPGRPPGWQRKPTHDVHEVLDVVHGLAFWVLNSPDTS